MRSCQWAIWGKQTKCGFSAYFAYLLLAAPRRSRERVAWFEERSDEKVFEGHQKLKKCAAERRTELILRFPFQCNGHILIQDNYLWTIKRSLTS